MDFGLSEEQRLLEQTIRGFLAERVPITRVRELVEASDPYAPELWKELAELGAAGVLVPEQCGGSGLALLDAALVAEALGHAVVPSPFLASSVMAPIALRALPEHPQKEPWLTAIAKGELRIGIAATEAFSKREDAGVCLEGERLRGKALMVLDLLGAELVLVATEDDALSVIRAEDRGVEITSLTTTDRTRRVGELVLRDARAEAVFPAAGAAIDRMLDAGRIALAADTLGAAEAMIEQSVEYAKQRSQFERVIASFQAVKHMCAEMIAELEPARSLLWYAAHSFDAVPEDAPLMAAQVQGHVAEIARGIASTATEVHGGIGFTDEQNLHFWFKRVGLARHLLGGPELLRERAAAFQGLSAAP